MISRRVLIAASTAALLSAVTRADASWPDGKVRIVVPVPAGGSPDLVARLLAEKLGARWGRPVWVDNRPGAEGIIAMTALVEANDASTLLLTPSGMLTVTPLVRDVPFDRLKDLRPVSMIAADFLAVVVPEASPVRSLNELVETARLNPNSLNWFAAAGAPALAFASFVRRNRLQTTSIPYKGGPDALRDLSESRIGVAVVPLSVARPLVEANRLRFLAITNPERAQGFANVPTVTEAGYPELTVEGMLGLLASRSMPPETARRLSEDVQAILSDGAVKAGLLSHGLLARGSRPDEYEQYLISQRSHWQFEAAAQQSNN
jgi:tripartite-type tricarboxylate transporter receptor subunit TctC